MCYTSSKEQQQRAERASKLEFSYQVLIADKTMVCCKCCKGYATLCRVFTHGWLIGAVILSCFAVGTCEFIRRDGASIGLFRWQRSSEEQCIAYNDYDNFDSGWLHDWARVSAVIAPLSGILVIALMLVDCCCNVCCNKYIQTFLVVCCQINQAFTFLIYASNACLTRNGGEFDTIFYKGCRAGDGTVLSCMAFFCYFVGGFFICCSPKPDPYCLTDKEDEEEDDEKRGCCGCKGKDKDEKKSDVKAKESDEKPAAAQEEKPNAEEPVVVAAAAAVVVKEEVKEEEEEEKVEEPKQQAAQTKAVEQTKEEEKIEEMAAVPDEEAPKETVAVPDEVAPEEKNAIPDEEAPETEAPKEEEEEAPAAVPVPVIVPADAPKAQTPPEQEAGTEVEFDEEFGMSIRGMCGAWE